MHVIFFKTYHLLNKIPINQNIRILHVLPVVAILVNNKLATKTQVEQNVAYFVKQCKLHILSLQVVIFVVPMLFSCQSFSILLISRVIVRKARIILSGCK